VYVRLFRDRIRDAVEVSSAVPPSLANLGKKVPAGIYRAINTVGSS